ncbi:unnamed protein product, partial [Meganyctiphanes norvegica]
MLSSEKKQIPEGGIAESIAQACQDSSKLTFTDLQNVENLLNDLQNAETENTSDTELNDINPSLLGSWRLYTSLVTMTGMALLMVFRMSLTMTLVCTPNIRNYTSNITVNCLLYNNITTEVQGSDPWSAEIQEHLLNSFFYGYILGQLMGGWTCDRLGGRVILLTSVAGSSFVTMSLPLAANIEHSALLLTRLLQGIFQGIGWSCPVYLVRRWGCPRDIHYLICVVYMGIPLGVILGFPVAQTLCIKGPTGSWPTLYYLTGFSGLIWWITAYFLLHNDPTQHPLVSETEKMYIGHNGWSKGSSKSAVPCVTMFKSPQVISIIGAQICCTFGYYILCLTPHRFMMDLFSFNSYQNYTLLLVPWIVEIPVSVAAAVGVHYLKTTSMSTTNIRKIFNTVGFVLAALSPVLMVELGCTWRQYAVIPLTLAQVGHCLAFVNGYLFAPMDLTPSFAATLTGISNAIQGVNAIFAPLVVYRLTPTGVVSEWRLVFWIAAILYLLGAAVFALWGSAKPLPWAEPVKCKEYKKYVPRTEEVIRGSPTEDKEFQNYMVLNGYAKELVHFRPLMVDGPEGSEGAVPSLVHRHRLGHEEVQQCFGQRRFSLQTSTKHDAIN